MFDLVLQGFGVFTPTNFLVIFVGTVAGLIMGAMPGISASMAVVIGMTFGYGMEPLPAIAFLVDLLCVHHRRQHHGDTVQHPGHTSQCGGDL